MPFARHYRLTASGVIMGGAAGTTAIERFSFRLNLSATLANDDQFNAQRASDYADDVAAFFARADSGIGPAAELQEVKLARIGADGKYELDPFIEERIQRGASGAAPKYPTQVALAVSLGSDRRGPTGKGRFYLPMPNLAMDDNLIISTTAAEACRGSVATLINDLNNVPGFDANSPQVVIASTKGYNTDVTSVRIGRVLDTMRSRRTSLLESYTAPVAVG